MRWESLNDLENERKDILIFSASFGGGHREVSYAVQKAINSLDSGIRVWVIDLLEIISPGINRLNACAYVKTMRNAPWIYGWVYELTYDLPLNNPLNRMTGKIGLGKLRRLIKDLAPKVLLSTYPTYGGMISELKKMGDVDLISTVVITDFVAHSQWIHPQVERYFVSSDEVKYHLIKKGISPETIDVTGIPISGDFLLPVDRAEVFEEFGLSDNSPVVFVMAGLFGMTRGVLEICEAIKELAMDVQTVILCGNDKKLFNKLKSTFSDRGIIKPIFGHVGVYKLMDIASVLISKSGGITVSEALAKELPVLIYRPLPGQEYHNAVFLSKTGAGIIINNKGELKDVLKFLLSDKGYLEQIKKASQFVKKPAASLDVAKRLISFLRD